MALENVGLFEKGNNAGITTSEWIKCLRDPDTTTEHIEAKLVFEFTLSTHNPSHKLKM
jgi:hypothetical protein